MADMVLTRWAQGGGPGTATTKAIFARHGDAPLIISDPSFRLALMIAGTTMPTTAAAMGSKDCY